MHAVHTWQLLDILNELLSLISSTCGNGSNIPPHSQQYSYQSQCVSQSVSRTLMKPALWMKKNQHNGVGGGR